MTKAALLLLFVGLAARAAADGVLAMGTGIDFDNFALGALHRRHAG